MTTAVRRSTADRYFIQAPLSPDSRYRTWAIISLSEAGEVQIFSDYGCWAYAWPNHGRKSLRHFLCEVGEDYLLRKLAKRKTYFDADATLRRIRDKIIERRRAGKLTRDGAREAWLHLQSIHDDYSQSVDLFVHECIGMTGLDLHQDASEGDLAVMDWESGVLGFVRTLWPVFIEALRRELEPSPRSTLEERALCAAFARE